MSAHITYADIRSLQSAVENRERLTKRLAEAVEKIALLITEHCDTGTEIIHKGISYMVVERSSRVRDFKSLTMEGDEIMCENEDETENLQPLYAMDIASSYFYKEGKILYAFGDFNCRMRIPSRKAILVFARDSKEILKKFTEKVQEQTTIAESRMLVIEDEEIEKKT